LSLNNYYIINYYKFTFYWYTNTIRWPGSVHDSTIFDNSLLRAQFENNKFEDAVLVGDGGYACRNYMMIPLSNPTTR
jgi:nuclease HARBI1